MTAVALALPATDSGFLASTGAVAAVLAASTFAGAAGASLGAVSGAVVGNTGGAVTAAFLLLMVAPPLVVQLASGDASWVPGTLTSVLSGVTHETDRPSAALGLLLWAAIPALAGLITVRRRDVV